MTLGRMNALKGITRVSDPSQDAPRGSVESLCAAYPCVGG